MDSEYDRMRARQERARAEASTDMAAARVHRQLAELFEERAGSGGDTPRALKLAVSR